MVGKPVYKLVVLGDGGVGKTALTIQLCRQRFVETYDPTIEDSYRKHTIIDNQACVIEILDTADQEGYIALQDQWIRGSEGFVLVYSISSRSSFSRIREIYRQIQQAKDSLAGLPKGLMPIVLVGNKSDQVAEREVSTQEGHALSRELGCEFVEASAKNCVNVEKAFYDVIRILRRQRQSAARPEPGIEYGDIGRPKGPQRYRRKDRKCIIL